MRLYFTLLLSILLHEAAICKTYDILAYGAEADGKTLNTKSIQKAIDACTPGDTVYIQSGRYLTGTVHLKSNITFYISKEGFLIGSSNIADYESYSPVANSQYYGILMAVNITNINITGSGTIEGSGADFKATATCPQQVMLFSGCSNITVQNLPMLNIPFNALEFIDCRNVNVLNLKMDGRPEATGSRGFDFKNCINTRISGCEVWSANNAIAISGSSKQVAINSCTLQSVASAIYIFSVDSNSVSDVMVNHVNINRSGRGIELAVVHSGSLESMRFTDLSIESVQRLRDSSLYGEPIYLSVTHLADSAKLGVIKNISFNNILCNAENQVKLSGIPQSLIQDIHFDTFVLNIRNSALTAVPVNIRSPAIAADHISGLNINNIAINWLVNPAQQYFSHGIAVSNFNGFKLSNYSVTAAPLSPNTHAVVLTDGALATVDAGDVLRVRITEPKVIKPAAKPVRKKTFPAKIITKL